MRFLFDASYNVKSLSMEITGELLVLVLQFLYCVEMQFRETHPGNNRALGSVDAADKFRAPLSATEMHLRIKLHWLHHHSVRPKPCGSSIFAEPCTIFQSVAPTTIHLSHHPRSQARSQRSTHTCRSFTTSTTRLKKGGSKGAPKEIPIPDNTAQKDRDAEADPYDFTELENGIASALEKLRDALSRTRSAGRLGTETIESFPVQLRSKNGSGSGSGSGKETVRLGDLATVVPKGARSMQVFVGEEDVGRTIFFLKSQCCFVERED